MLDLDRQNIENIFLGHMKKNGFVFKPELSLIPPEIDKSLYFTNATVVNFKEDLLAGVTQNKATKQKCLRLHNSSKILDDDYVVEWMNLFNMVGSIISPYSIKDHKQTIMDLFINEYKIDLKDIKILADKKDKSLYCGFPDNMMLFNTEPQSFYSWHFGMENIYGKGLTISININDSLVGIANLIEIRDRSSILGYEFAYGLECCLWAKNKNISILETYPSYRIFNKMNVPDITKVLDTIMTVSAIETTGIEPVNSTPRGQILKKQYRNLVYLAEKSFLHDAEIKSIYKNVSETEFNNMLDIDNFHNNYIILKNLVNTQRETFLARKDKLVMQHGSGLLSESKLCKKLHNLAEGECYIGLHERAKYCAINNRGEK